MAHVAFKKEREPKQPKRKSSMGEAVEPDLCRFLVEKCLEVMGMPNLHVDEERCQLSFSSQAPVQCAVLV